MSNLRQIWVLSIVSGIFLMSNNAMAIIVPIRMIDSNLSYADIGGVLAAFSFGTMLIKIITGRHSDLVGKKLYLLASIGISAILILFIIFAKTLIHYVILLCLLGLCRGAFTSVYTPYIIELTDNNSCGKGIGIVNGISSAFTALGSLIAGWLYKFHRGDLAFLAFSICLLLVVIITLKVLPNTKTIRENEKFFNVKLFKDVDKSILLLCAIVFFQMFVTDTLYQLVIPMTFYTIFSYSALFVGTLMSIDEIIGFPIYFLAGYLSDKLSVKHMLGYCFLGGAGVSLLMLQMKYPLIVISGLFVSSIFVTGTYVAIPKATSLFIRDYAKGFDYVLVSISASTGSLLGNIVIGKITSHFTLSAGIVSFIFVYVAIGLFVLISKRFMSEQSQTEQPKI